MTRAAARDFWSLTKPGITRHVVVCAAAGFVLAGGLPDWATLAWLSLGTALVSGGTNALNQWWERDTDARMPRTRRRPLASRRVAPPAALAFGILIGIAGVTVLARAANALTAALAAITLLGYVLAYTPLKKRSSLNTLVGCVPGALPILGGWTAATGRIEAGGLALFAVLYLWQLPHTLALTWLYRRDYLAAGLVMPGWNDAAGRITATKATLYAVLLLGASLLPAWLRVTGAGYAALAAALGLALLALAIRWMLRPTPARARQLFFATLVHLPALLAGMVFLPR